MTISSATPRLRPSSLRSLIAGQDPDVQQAPDTERSAEFRLGPEHSAADAVQRAHGFAAAVMPALLATSPEATRAGQSALAVLTELIDITARHRASVDLAGRISCDGEHVLLTVGEMDRPLPAPEEEPGLFLVHRLADDVGQHRGDEAGHATWASVPLRG
ncbi:hypothetical protein U9R90_27075 [Streptomyces sp. E11-3]|uniref:hypothetical protein n=1 Tax=Streptomyces sp. E11-3 TaxID=3110112 RepID=UPI003980F01D